MRSTPFIFLHGPCHTSAAGAGARECLSQSLSSRRRSGRRQARSPSRRDSSARNDFRSDILFGKAREIARLHAVIPSSHVYPTFSTSAASRMRREFRPRSVRGTTAQRPRLHQRRGDGLLRRTAASASGESATDFCPGNRLHRATIEFRHAPVHLDCPGGLSVLVHLAVEAVEQ
jgi:hypothetical protein